MPKAIYLCLLIHLCLLPCEILGQDAARAKVVDRINLGVEYLAAKEHLKSIEELIGAKDTALQNGWYLQAFNATLNIGTNYYLLMDYGEAFQYYLEAYEIALNHLGPRQEMAVYNNIGVLYIEEKEEEKAEESFYKAYSLAKNLDIKKQVGTYGINLALVLNKMKELDRAETYINEALPLLRDTPNVLLLGKIAKAENLQLRGKLAEAAQLALEILPQIENLSLLQEQITVNDKITILLILSRIFEGQENVDEALKYALQARASQENMEARSTIYDRLANLYARNREFEKALAYKDSMTIATDSLYSVKNSALYKSEKVKFQIRNYQHELSQSKETLKRDRQTFYISILFVILLMGFLVWIFKNNSQKEKQRKRIVELELEKEKNDRLYIQRQHREKEALALLEKERLNTELEKKNRELTSRAMYLASKNELIEEVVQSLSRHPHIADNGSIKKQINDLKKHLKNDTQWDGFFMHFEKLNQGFLDRLRAKHPKLTPNDIRFISFLYMNLSYKEIASLLNITPQSCRKRKERISKKMQVPDNLQLHAYLASI